MTTTELENLIIKQIRESVTLDQYDEKYQVNLPLYYADGDGLRIILKPEPDGNWCLTDEAHTMMYLSYYNIKVEDAGLRRNVLNKILAQHDVQEDDGRIIMKHISTDSLADAIFDFSSALLSLGDFTLWKKERAKVRLKMDFQRAVQTAARGRECRFDYADPNVDPHRDYPIDCFISGDGKRDAHVYVIGNDYNARGAVISIYRYREHHVLALPCAVFSGNDVSDRSRTQISNVDAVTFDNFENMINLLSNRLENTSAAD